MFVNFPITRPIVVDTETYYDDECSVRSNKRGWVGGNWHYTNHPKFYCYMVTFLDLETGEKGILDDRSEFEAFVASLEGRTLVMHNAGFDCAVLKSIKPDFEPFNTIDTADMSQYLQYPRALADVVLHLFGKKVSKTERDNMKGVHYHDLDKARRDSMRQYALGDAEWTAEVYRSLLDQWPPIERFMSDYNRRQNWQGINIDREYLQVQIDRVNTRRNAALGSIPWVQNAATDTPMSAKKLAIYCREVGIEPPESLAEDSEECQAWERRYGNTYPVVGAIRDYRKSNTYFKKLKLVEALLRPDGTIPLSTMYVAAPHTLRFSAKQFNYQSLSRDTDFCDMRGYLVPPSGKAFVGADLSGIEARCLPWLAGDFDFLDNLAVLDNAARAEGVSGGGDLYEPHARRMFAYSNPKPLKKTDKPLRLATKVCVLQLGYQSGGAKFHWFLDNNVPKEVLDRVRAGNETDAELALRLVKLFRGMNPKVVDLWYSLDRELRSSVGGTYSIQLPNGGIVNYFNIGVRTGKDKEGKTRAEIVGQNCRGADHKNLYGGKLTENICQRMARDVIVESIYRLHAAGFPTRMTIHDENVPTVPLDAVSNPETAKAVCREVENIMSVTPDWAPRLPLASETGILHRYAK